MKKLIALIVTVFVLAAATAPVTRAGEIKIGYVDTRKVMTESKAGKEVRTELEKLMKTKQAEIDRQEKALKDMQAAFEKDKLILTAEQKKTRQKEFQEKLAAYQKLKAEAQRELQQKDQAYTREAVGEIQQIVAGIAKAQGLALVFDSRERPVLYSAPGPDLTEEVMKQYDAKAK